MPGNLPAPASRDDKRFVVVRIVILCILAAMETPSQIIKALGGYRKVAELLSQLGAKPVSAVRVHNWTRRAIPAEFWPELVQVAQAEKIEGVTFATLRAAKAAEASQASAA